MDRYRPSNVPLDNGCMCYRLPSVQICNKVIHMNCCNQNCNQGRTCPNRQQLSLNEVWSKIVVFFRKKQ